MPTVDVNPERGKKCDQHGKKSKRRTKKKGEKGRLGITEITGPERVGKKARP